MCSRVYERIDADTPARQAPRAVTRKWLCARYVARRDVIAENYSERETRTDRQAIDLRSRCARGMKSLSC